jgi:methyl-accepting chemotaxis protein
MRTLSTFSYLFFILLLVSIGMVAMGSYSWLIIGCLVTTLVLGSAATFLWLRVLRDAVVESRSLVSKTAVKTRVSFANLDVLAENHAGIAKKFETSAAFISNLSNPEKLKSMADIDTQDEIGGAIQSIRSEMQRVKDEEDKRNWVTQGLAKFAEVLRGKAEIKQYAGKIIGQLVRYVGVNQGGIYIEGKDEEGNRCLDLMACYAYSKQLAKESRIPLGSGLLGQCMVERELVFMTDIPRDYVKITSGLGEATPRNVVIAPLLFNNEFYGAIELVSFEHLQPHQVEFVKEVCQSIAAEVASLQSISHTQRLLNESNVLAEKLQARESELQHHLETLSVTQQEMSRNQAELSGTINAINGTLASANFTVDGAYVSANAIFLKVLGYDEEKVRGKGIDFFTGNDPSIRMMWENLRLGKCFSGEFKLRDHAGKEMWLTGTFNPIIVEGDMPHKILMLAQFTTQEKEKLNELSGMVSALKSSLPVLEFNADFSCKTANEKALKLFNLSRLQLRTKRINDFFAAGFEQQWGRHQAEVLKSDSMMLCIPMALQEQMATFEVSFSLTRCLDGSVTKVVLIMIRQLAENVSMVA